MRIEIWSDVVCPWCYVGKRNLDAALSTFEHRDEVDVVWRSYELDPHAPPEREGRYAERLARKYRVSLEEADAMIARIAAAGVAAGLELRFDIARFGSTFDAHRLVHLGAEHGMQGAVKERFFAATFLEGEPIGRREALVRLATDVGLPEADVQETLDGDRFADAVLADRRAAEDHDVTGVPFFLVDGRYGIPGAQPPALLRRVLERRWAEAAAAPACRDDTC